MTGGALLAASSITGGGGGLLIPWTVLAPVVALPWGIIVFGIRAIIKGDLVPRSTAEYYKKAHEVSQEQVTALLHGPVRATTEVLDATTQVIRGEPS